MCKQPFMPNMPQRILCYAKECEREHGRNRYAKWQRETAKGRAGVARGRAIRKVAKGDAVERIDPIAVFERDGWRCHICGKMTLRDKRGTVHPLAPELDHVMPLSLGGQHVLGNVRCACARCNHMKGAKPLGQPLLIG